MVPRSKHPNLLMKSLGDFSLSNLIFARDHGKWNVRAIVDWELSTLVGNFTAGLINSISSEG